MCVVIRFHDVLAGVVQPAISEQKSKAAQLQIILVIFLDCVRDKRDADLIQFAPPCRPGVISAESKCLVIFRVGEGFVLAFVPAEASADAEIAGDVLLQVEIDAILQTRRNVRRM